VRSPLFSFIFNQMLTSFIGIKCDFATLEVSA
jgi:hypothetical protein